MLKGKIIIVLMCMVSLCSKAQDSLFTYAKIINADSLSKEQIYDRALIWLGKVLNDSRNAIKVQERQSGLISGKAYVDLTYKYPGKRDSLFGTIYNDYTFDWLTQIKDSKLKFSISEIEMHGLYYSGYVTNSDVGPGRSVLLSKTRNDAEWISSKYYFKKMLDLLMAQLEDELKTNSDF